MARRFRIPPPPRLRPGTGYAIAVALPLAALAVQHELRAWVENIPFVLFFVVVSFVASAGGTGPGVLCVACSAVSGWWFQVSSPDPSNRAGAVVGALVFAPAGLAIALLGGLVRAGFREREDAARELVAAVRARDEFISMASHELKTPLTSLTLSVHRLSRPESERRTLDDPGIARAVALIARQTARLNVLVSNLLDVSRLKPGRLHLELREVDLADVVRAVASRFEEQLGHGETTLTIKVAGPVLGRWDRLRLEQVVTNLLANAFKYGHGSPVEISVGQRGEQAVLAVSDRGVGIRPEDQARVFERFERVDSRNAAGGFGLGLWIVREIVGALEGTVTVESALGRGATFTVHLPLRGPSLRDE